MYDTDEEQEKLILFAIDYNNNEIDANLNELSELVKTAGGIEVGRLTQRKERPHNGLYFGKGKVDELISLVELTKATGVVCDDELTNNQLSNLEKLLDVKIMDRTMIILDIFAKHAVSNDGKLQVELAQLKYSSSHLIGLRNLSRQGGGIGSRGPGEKKLETDRRYINDKITELEQELKQLSTQRKVQREKRERNGIPLISLVGYTNAGKSTLMNTISNSNILAIDKLFATLDTTTRKVLLSNNYEVLFSDTVGFINKLPHHLIKAFKSTLEELQYADIIIHVVDISSPDRDTQMEIVNKTLVQLNCQKKPIIIVYNKIDNEYIKPMHIDKSNYNSILISAKNKIGIEELQNKIEQILKSFKKEIHIKIPYSDSKVLNSIHSYCEIIKEDYQESGIYVHLFATKELQNKLEKYTFIKVLD